jgi:hypothetical protein
MIFGSWRPGCLAGAGRLERRVRPRPAILAKKARGTPELTDPHAANEPTAGVSAAWACPAAGNAFGRRDDLPSAAGSTNWNSTDSLASNPC